MINKKLLAAASLVAVVSTSSAFAKTEGNYVGVDLLATQIKVLNDDNARKSNFGYGVGLNYKHAFNFNNFFVAPGAFYNFNHAEVKADGDKTKLEYSYGVKADFGYDINDKFAAFTTFGYQENRLKGFGDGKETLESFIYGVGVKYSLTNNVDVGLAYEYVNYVDSDIPNSLSPEVIKVGASYKF